MLQYVERDELCLKSAIQVPMQRPRSGEKQFAFMAS